MAKHPNRDASSEPNPSGAVSFQRCNIYELQMTPTCAHKGTGEIKFCRIADSGKLAGNCNFIDFTVMPPGTTIGEHTHNADEEEFYLIIEGNGVMRSSNEEFGVRPGDLIRNPPLGTHGLCNPGPGELKLFVFEVAVGTGKAAAKRAV